MNKIGYLQSANQPVRYKTIAKTTAMSFKYPKMKDAVYEANLQSNPRSTCDQTSYPWPTPKKRQRVSSTIRRLSLDPNFDRRPSVLPLRCCYPNAAVDGSRRHLFPHHQPKERRCGGSSRRKCRHDDVDRWSPAKGVATRLPLVDDDGPTTVVKRRCVWIIDPETVRPHHRYLSPSLVVARRWKLHADHRCSRQNGARWSNCFLSKVLPKLLRQ